MMSSLSMYYELGQWCDLYETVCPVWTPKRAQSHTFYIVAEFRTDIRL